MVLTLVLLLALVGGAVWFVFLRPNPRGAEQAMREVIAATEAGDARRLESLLWRNAKVLEPPDRAGDLLAFYRAALQLSGSGTAQAGAPTREVGRAQRSGSIKVRGPGLLPRKWDFWQVPVTARASGAGAERKRNYSFVWDRREWRLAHGATVRAWEWNNEMEETLKPLAGQLAQQLGQQLSQASGAVPGTGALADGLSQGGADLTAPKAHYEAGMAAKQAGDLQRAAQELAEASRLAPDWADPHWALAWVYAGMGDKPRAIEAFNQVVLLDKDRAVEARQAILRLTPPSSLYDAAVKGDIETAKRLIAAGAEISASGDSFGNTPLDVAANRDNAALVELLIGHGADVRGGPDPQTALHNAAFYGCPAAARVLLRHGADPKARGERGHTPLHLAARKGHTDIAKLLLEHRSDINARDTEGKTPLTYALDASQTAMADFLRARGGKQ